MEFFLFFCSDIRDRIIAIQNKTGFVPNIFLALAHRPEKFKAFFSYHDALIPATTATTATTTALSALTRAEREMIVVATSALKQCQYCVASHGAVVCLLSL